jgi:hypothetical protein
MEPDLDLANAGTTLWCAGLPLVAERPLAESECELLQAAIRRSRRIAAIALAAPWILAVAGFSLAFKLGDTSAGNTVAAITAIGLALTLIFSVLIGRDHNSVVNGLRRDLEVGTVEQYQGVLEPPPFDTLNMQRLRKEGVETSIPMSLSFELLGGSGFMLSVGAKLCTKWTPLTRNRVGKPVADDYEERLAPAPRIANLPAGTELAKRDLSPDEIVEVKRYIRRLYRAKLGSAVWFTLWVSLPLILTGQPPREAAMWYPLVAVALLSDYLYARDVIMAVKLKADLKMPVTVVDRAAVARQVPGQPTRVEILGRSRLQWRADGKPAHWRRLG